jgi:hypothetical protein
MVLSIGLYSSGKHAQNNPHNYFELSRPFGLKVGIHIWNITALKLEWGHE